MSKVDEELARRLRRAERSMDGDGLFEGLVARRSRRGRLRRIQAGLVAFAVLTGTVSAFVALRAAFEGDGRRDVGVQPLHSNGQIVFVNEAQDGRLEIYAALPDGTGLRQLTDAELNNSDPAASPDGSMVAYAHQVRGAGGSVLEVLPIEGGSVLWRSAEHYDISDPEWSPDGSRIMFLAFTRDTTDLYVATFGTDEAERVELSPDLTARMATDGLDTLVHPTWSPDGSRIAVAVRTEAGVLPTSWDIAVMRPDGTGAEWLVATDDQDEVVPAWSPDGSRIAFQRRTATTSEQAETGIIPGQDEVWTISSAGTDERLVATTDGGSLRLSLTWAPDATSMLVADGNWISRVDPSPASDPRDNFVRLLKGFSPSWQPLPAGSDLSPTPEPSISPEPEPAGRDIGLSFRLCHLHPLGGIDFLGDGTGSRAWTGLRVDGRGRCPSESEGATGLVATDVDGDGEADAFSETIEYCFYCRPFAAVDLDADGDDELAVMTSEGSTPSFMVYATFRTSDGIRIEPILVAAPGHPEAGEDPDEPLQFGSGGDEGYAAWIGCERFPEDPILVITWRDAPIDGDTMEVHVTRFDLLEDGTFHVIGENDYSAPNGDPIPGVSDAPACGIDWQIWG